MAAANSCIRVETASATESYANPTACVAAASPLNQPDELSGLNIDMKYMVRCFSKGRLDGNEPREVEAESAHQAAETLCGGPLEYTGRFSELRAEVWPINKPASKLLLYRPYRQ
jgi:hypothetical protein